ncbi:hypothetical protein MRX96_034953 [Rhipicephalus microplus]
MARLSASNKVPLMELKEQKNKLKSLQNEDLQHRLQQHDIPDRFIKQTGFCGIPETNLVNCMMRAKLIHPNLNVYYLLKATKKEFAKQPNDNCVYSKTLDHVLLTYSFMFPCSLHKADVMVEVLDYYIFMRMRQHCKQQRQKQAKKSQEMRKWSKLV